MYFGRASCFERRFVFELLYAKFITSMLYQNKARALQFSLIHPPTWN